MKFVKFSSIEQLSTVIKNIKHSAQYTGQDENNEAVFDRFARSPVLTFKGTVKSHGTNAGVSHTFEDGIYGQKRTDICTLDNDNAGFAVYVHSHKDFFTNLMLDLRKEYSIPEQDILTLFGEWCGGNIQKGVSITGLPKMFIVFGLKQTTLGDTEEDNVGTTLDYTISSIIKVNSDKNFYVINDFGEYELTVDLNNFALEQNKFLELTLEVEKECPIGKYFGRVLGKDITTGEGIVWQTEYKGSRYVTKVKGEAHSNSKVKTLKVVDNVKEQLKNDIAQQVTPSWRLTQMFAEANNTINGDIPDIKNIGTFLKMVNSDIIKEELDTIISVGLEPKDIFGAVAQIIKPWYKEELDRFIVEM